MTQVQEGRKHQQLKEEWNLWWTFLHKIVEWRARKYHKLPGFHQHLYSAFWQKICRKEIFVPDGSLTAWLLNRNRNAWKLQHYWNKDLTLKVKHSFIELSLLTKRRLETLNRSWNCSQTSGEVQPSSDPENFDERNQRSSKWWSLFMITEELSWHIEFHDEQVWQQHIVVTGRKNCAEKCTKNRPDLLGDGSLILHDNARPHLGKVVTDLVSKYEWDVLSHAPYSPDMSLPDFDLFHKLKEPIRGHCFPSLEEVSAAVTRAIRRLKKSGTLNGLANLPKRWDAVIEKQED